MSTIRRVLCLLLALALMWTVPAAALYRVTVSGTFDYTLAYEALDAMNEYRAQYGLRRLTMDRELLEAAMLRAAEISISWSHTRPNGTQFFTVCPKMYGENLAKDYNTLSVVMYAWKHSPDHNAIMLDSSYQSVGIGVAKIGGAWYWTQCFSRHTAAPENPRTSGQQEKSYTVETIAHDHSWGSGTVTKQPTCTGTGVRTFTCACGETKTETIPAMAHNYVNGYCSRCGQTDPDSIPSYHLPGDINGDRTVNNRDLTRLAQLLAGRSADFVPGSPDVNGDGYVNNRDLTRLAQHLAGKSVELH